jgi:rod shape-determining protein MreD
VRRSTRITILAACAVVLQTAVVDRLPLPGGTVPDLLLIVIVGAALAAGPTTGAVCGFACGMALDVLPPAETELGRQAVVLCLVGFIAGRMDQGVRRSPPLAFGVLALVIVLAAVADTVLGAVVGDPRASVGALLAVLPGSLLATMILSPFVLYVVLRLLGRAAEDEAPYIGTAIGVASSARGGMR